MPTNTQNKPVLVTYEVGAPEWNVVEGIRSRFTTPVNNKDGGPKMTKEGVQQVRKENADKILERIVSALLLNASEETLSNLAGEAQDKKTVTGEAPKFSVSDFISSIVTARPVASSSGVDLSKLTDEELAAEQKRRENAKKAGKGTKDVGAV